MTKPTVAPPQDEAELEKLVEDLKEQITQLENDKKSAEDRASQRYTQLLHATRETDRVVQALEAEKWNVKNEQGISRRFEQRAVGAISALRDDLFQKQIALSNANRANAEIPSLYQQILQLQGEKTALEEKLKAQNWTATQKLQNMLQNVQEEIKKQVAEKEARLKEAFDAQLTKTLHDKNQQLQHMKAALQREQHEAIAFRAQLQAWNQKQNLHKSSSDNSGNQQTPQGHATIGEVVPDVNPLQKHHPAENEGTPEKRRKIDNFGAYTFITPGPRRVRPIAEINNVAVSMLEPVSSVSDQGTVARAQAWAAQNIMTPCVTSIPGAASSPYEHLSMQPSNLNNGHATFRVSELNGPISQGQYNQRVSDQYMLTSPSRQATTQRPSEVIRTQCQVSRPPSSPFLPIDVPSTSPLLSYRGQNILPTSNEHFNRVLLQQHQQHQRRMDSAAGRYTSSIPSPYNERAPPDSTTQEVSQGSQDIALGITASETLSQPVVSNAQARCEFERELPKTAAEGDKLHSISRNNTRRGVDTPDVRTKCGNAAAAIGMPTPTKAYPATHAPHANIEPIASNKSTPIDDSVGPYNSVVASMLNSTNTTSATGVIAQTPIIIDDEEAGPIDSIRNNNTQRVPDISLPIEESQMPEEYRTLFEKHFGPQDGTVRELIQPSPVKRSAVPSRALQ